MNILVVFGTRPEYLKVKPILAAAKGNSNHVFKSLFIKQHTDIIDFKNYDFSIDLSNSRDSRDNRLNNIISDICSKTYDIFSQFDAILVQGDTATTLGASLSAFNLRKSVFYVESGLRTLDRENPFPEEVYRRCVSHLAKTHFCPTEVSKQNLLKDLIDESNIHVVGNTAIDNLVDINYRYGDTVLITLHRRENQPIIREWLQQIDLLASQNTHLKFIFLVHPTPEIKNASKSLKSVRCSAPLEHDGLIDVLKDARIVITDSGGLVEEASFLKKKSIVCRKTTERPEGIKTGHLIMCENPQKLVDTFNSIKDDYKVYEKSPYGDGTAGKQIVKILNNYD
jgi:UDP-N-acetylglucosamine 2-epimerase (non-hydrolysing)